MLQVTRSDVTARPYPHVVKQGILPDELFARLRRDFPTETLFESQHDVSGSVGSRVGKGTGFDIYRGDQTYDALIAQSDAWREFDEYINSPAFVAKFNEVFGQDLDALGCSISVDPGAYERDDVEPRSVLTARDTIGDKVRHALHKLGGKSNASTPLFTRLDIEKSMGGYAKPPHCDRKNRLCSLIVYFTDMEQEGIEGGELNIYAHKTKTDPASHERHPKEADLDLVATLTPRQNLGVFFPCSNNSYHGVNAVRTKGKARDFLYINISSATPSCWK